MECNMGQIAVTIRTNDGAEYRMCRGVVNLSDFLGRLSAGAPGSIDEYLAGWKALIAQSETSGDGVARANARLYALQGGLFPYDAGLLVVDIPSRTVLSAGFEPGCVDGFRVRQFDCESQYDAAGLLGAVKDLGFVLNEHEKAVWSRLFGSFGND